MSNPTISVIIPTHNRPLLLARALESVFAQTFLPEEIVVVDDASSVSYRGVLARRQPAGRVKLLYHRLEKGLGGSAARNRGAELSQGEILMFLDDDDTWLPTKIEGQLNVFRDQPAAGLVYSGRRAVNEHGEFLFSVVPKAAGHIHRLLLQRNYIGITSAVALRREVFFETEGFDPALPARQDYDLWIRASRLTAVAYDPQPTVNWMIHSEPGKQISGDPMKYRQAVEAIFRKYAPDYAALSLLQRRRAFSSQYVILAEKCALAGSSRQYIYALKALLNYPSAAALSRLLPYRFWLKLRTLLGRGGREGAGNGQTTKSRSYTTLERSAGRLLDRFPMLRRTVRLIYMRLNYLIYRERGFRVALAPGLQIISPYCWVRGLSSGTGNSGKGEERGPFFFGYYDKTPWSPDGERLLMHHLSSPNGAVEILTFNRRERAIEILGSSTAWNYQQGSMAQWLPGSGGQKIIFNDLVEENLSARIITLPDEHREGENPSRLPEKVIPWPVQAAHPSGKEILSLNYRRLHRLRPEYGYAVEATNFSSDLPLSKDGIWKVDLTTGEAHLIISLADLAAHESRPEMKGAEHKVNHILYSPRGTGFVFVHRWLGPQGKFSRLYWAPPGGTPFRLLLDYRMISHYCWRDECYLLAWARAPEAGDAYYLIDTLTGDRQPLGEGVADRYGDGHPSFSPDGNRLVTDSYPDRARQRHLLLYDLQGNRLLELGRFFAPWHFDGPRRSDLHPRWSPDGKAISIDSAHQGKRRSYILLPDDQPGGPNQGDGRLCENHSP